MPHTCYSTQNHAKNVKKIKIKQFMTSGYIVFILKGVRILLNNAKICITEEGGKKANQ